MSVWGYRIRYILQKLHLNIRKFNALNPQIIKSDPNIIFIFGSLIYSDYIAKIRQIFPKVRLIYLYSNLVKDKASIYPDLLDQYNCEKYTWDKSDCTKYGINYSKPFYQNSFSLQWNENFIHDAVFIGVDKGRYSLLKKLEAYLNAHCIRTYFHIVSDSKLTRFKKTDYKKPISYSEYLNHIKISKCIIDIVQQGQYGLTMRIFEAIFNNRKIITNNKNIKEYDFYTPENIFILDGSNIDERLLAFINSPIVPIDKNIINTYCFDSWLNQFNLIQ